MNIAEVIAIVTASLCMVTWLMRDRIADAMARRMGNPSKREKGSTE